MGAYCVYLSVWSYCRQARSPGAGSLTSQVECCNIPSSEIRSHKKNNSMLVPQYSAQQKKKLVSSVNLQNPSNFYALPLAAASWQESHAIPRLSTELGSNLRIFLYAFFLSDVRTALSDVLLRDFAEHYTNLCRHKPKWNQGPYIKDNVNHSLFKYFCLNTQWCKFSIIKSNKTHISQNLF